MWLGVFVFLQLLSGAQLFSVKRILSEQEADEVFVGEGEANSFLGRQLLYNRFDFEMFVQGDIERECREEICNYEEAREAFEDIPATDIFWEQYVKEQSGQSPSRVDVTGLLVGIISGLVVIVIAAVLVWYFCQNQHKGNYSRPTSVRARPSRTNAALLMQRLDNAQPAAPHVVPPPGLPSYDQAVTASGIHDAPPPPYPGSRPASVQQ